MPYISIPLIYLKFYHISNFIKKGRLKTDQLITISGNNIVNSSIIRVKIGTSLKEVFKSIKGLGNSSIFIVNGLMSGKEIDINKDTIFEQSAKN